MRQYREGPLLHCSFMMMAFPEQILKGRASHVPCMQEVTKKTGARIIAAPG